LDGNIPDFSFNCMGWNATTLADFIGDNLGPSLEQAGYEAIKLMAIDDQRPFIREWSRTIMSNPKARLL
jgi:glucosylceramidase